MDEDVKPGEDQRNDAAEPSNGVVTSSLLSTSLAPSSDARPQRGDPAHAIDAPHADVTMDDAKLGVHQDLETLRIRRDKLIHDVNSYIEKLCLLVGSDERGALLIARVKSRIIFSIQRISHYCLLRESTEDQTADCVEERRASELKYLRCCVKVYVSAIEDLKALCGVSSSRGGDSDVSTKRGRDDDTVVVDHAGLRE